MAEIITPNATGKKRNTKCSKQSTRVDLTPMVDLGFLLITFFIFTTTLSDPKAIFMPLPKDDAGNDTEIAEGKTLQLFLDGPDQVKYYNGNDSSHIASTNYSASGLREVVREKVAMVKAAYKDPSETIVIIHPGNNAIYGNLVDVLDEMQINGVKRYMLVD